MCTYIWFFPLWMWNLFTNSADIIRHMRVLLLLLFVVVAPGTHLPTTRAERRKKREEFDFFSLLLLGSFHFLIAFARCCHHYFPSLSLRFTGARIYLYKLSEPKHDDYKRFIIEYDLIRVRQNEVAMLRVHFDGGLIPISKVYVCARLCIFYSLWHRVFVFDRKSFWQHHI